MTHPHSHLWGDVTAQSQSVIRVTNFVKEGDGSEETPWQLTRASLHAAVKTMDRQHKTLYFQAGIYECREPIEINFAKLFPATIGKNEDLQTDPKYQMLREGVRFVGEGRASIIRSVGKPLKSDIFFHVHWTVDDGKRRKGAKIRQAPLFFWEFTGLHFQGTSRSTLVQLGGPTVEDCAFNSCVIDLVAHNDNKDPNAEARGIVLKRVLQSRVELVATCHMGTACVLENCEFNTINGSFSNGEVKDESAETETAIARGTALHMLHCAANGSTSINIEVAFEGIRLEGFSGGNAFSTIVSNNCDQRGCVINDDLVEVGMANVVQCVVRRDVRQQQGVFQPLFSGGSRGAVSVLHNMPSSIEAGLDELHEGRRRQPQDSYELSVAWKKRADQRVKKQAGKASKKKR